MAMEDAIALADALAKHEDRDAALTYYEEARAPVVEATQTAARESYTYFENIDRYARMEPMQFTFNLLTRSGRITYDTLRVRDSRFLTAVDRWYARRTRRTDAPVLIAPPPMFTPLALHGMTLHNRAVLSPVSSYAARDGCPDGTHEELLIMPALGGAGLVMTEVTAVSPPGRITPSDTGIYTQEQAAAWRRIVAAIHDRSPAKVALRLGHAGPRGSTRPRFEGLDRPLRAGNWPLLAASARPYGRGSQTPREMDHADMERVRQEFVHAVGLAAEAGFDLLALHFAHGYLLASFISPLTNRRRDEYGGPLENRLRYPLEVFAAVRAAWPAEKPLSVAINATDWARGGFDVEDAAIAARLLKERGCDAIEVLAGQTVPDEQPLYGPAFLSPYSDRIRNEAGIATIIRGNITTADQINTLLAAGRADLCVLDIRG